MEYAIYEKVLEICCELVNASENDDTKRFWKVYQYLHSICINNEGLKSDHPLQWEALADFTADDIVSIPIYEKALNIAEKLQLKEYMASINFAIAERYSDLGNKDSSIRYANIANDIAAKTNDLDLRTAISELLLDEHGST